MDPQTPRRVPTIIIRSEFRESDPPLTAFRQKYPGWLESLEPKGAVYRLPREAVEGLKKPPTTRSPILTRTEAEVELAFCDLCQDSHAIGFWNGNFIKASYFLRPDPVPRALVQKMNWTSRMVATVEQLVVKTDSIASRLKGYVGWLVTDPVFIQARDELSAQWLALPAGERPYPITRAIRVPEQPAEGQIATHDLVSFQQSLNSFLDHWGLTRMMTWDLPEPQGPMLPAVLSTDSPAMPKHGLHMVLPIHYPLTGTDDLLHQIREQQAHLAQEYGLDTSMAGLPHFEVYGQMLEVDLLEKTIRSRCGKPGRRRGLVTTMESVIAVTLGRSLAQIQKLRKGIAACRAGKRSQIKWLKTYK
jgi:hypothetical protein